MAPDAGRRPLPYFRHDDQSRARGTPYFDRLAMLKARLMIFMYRHPPDNLAQVADIIDNIASTGEIQLMLDYLLARLVRARARASLHPGPALAA